ncbi:hypothetical protein C8R43DRAFT_372824 [Mycena crocata]|nr:hypothetical protein C8R43DRAFT_372824 [Mycena crocata]
MASAPALPSTSTFSFKAPLSLASGSGSGAGAAAAAPSQKQRRVSLALPSSPRLVPAWNFRDDTSVPYARKGKMRRIDLTADEGGEGSERDAEEKTHEDGDGSTPAPSGAPEKKVRRKWTAEETQMLIDGCNIHGVGNWKAILSDPNLSFASRSPVDLKDRFRTYFPEAYRTHYPNARTHIPPSLGRATSPSGTHSPSSSSLIHLPASASASSSKPNRSTHPDGTPLFPLPSPAHPKRRPFTSEEDAALLAGFRRHGAAWAAIAKDAPVFGQTGRRSMDLRDRFRNAWPGEYERAGYKARPRAAKKQAKEKDSKEKVKEEEGAGHADGAKEEVRGRGRVGRAQTDVALGRVAAAATTPTSPGTGEGGPVRRRRRAHTSQGFKTLSMPPSVVGSDDEGEGGGGATSDFGAFARAESASDFAFKFVTQGMGQGKGEETALVGGMRHLDMAPDEAMPDAAATPAQEAPSIAPPPPPPPPPPPGPSKFQTHFQQHRRQEDLGLGLGMNPSNGGTIGRSAWGTQDWLSANPRLDPSAAFSPSSFAYPQSPQLSSGASFPAPGHGPGTDTDTGGFFELAHGVMERYDLEPAALTHHHHHHHHHAAPTTAGSAATFFPPHAFSSPALSFHSTSLSFDTPHTSHSLSEAGDGDVFDEDSSAFSIAESEPGGAASWAGAAGGGGGGFRGFTHHSNTAGDLIFGARTHQPIWSGVDAWGARGRGLAGIAEQGGKRGEDGDVYVDVEAQAEAGDADDDDKALGLFSLDDLVDLSHEPPDADMDGTGAMGSLEMQMEPPGTPLLRASPAPARTVHVHHHHHHHHHYAATARSVSVPPGEAPEDGIAMGLGLGMGSGMGLMSAPATPAIGAAAVRTPPSAFALDPALLGLSPNTAHTHAHVHANPPNTLHAALMPPPGHTNVETMYNLPFLDLHYFGGGGGASAGDAGLQQMQLEGWRGGEALDLARSTSQGFAPSAFSFSGSTPPSQMLQTLQTQTQTQQPPGRASTPGVWKALGIPASLRQHIPGSARPLMRSASGGVSGRLAGLKAGAGGNGAESGSGSGNPNANGRSVNHQRGQSAVVCPQDLVASVSPETAGSKGKRKRASWDGGAW